MNKKFYIYLIFFLAVNTAISQNISFNELLKSKTYDFDKLETFLIEKGFEYFKSTNDELSKAYHFSFKEDGVIVAYFSDWTDHDPKGEKYISLQVPKKIFERIKKEGKRTGMKFIKKEDQYDGNGYFTTYEYSKYEISFYVAKGREEINRGETIYEINVSSK